MTLPFPAMPPLAATCRTCGSLHTKSLGRLPDVSAFAGATLDTALEGGRLYACGDCAFVFRAPVLSDADYVALYARGSTVVWEQNDDREDFRLVRSEITSEAAETPGQSPRNTPGKTPADASSDVLDVGCYTGHLLASLPATWRLHGVEPNAEAAAVAASRGVQIVAAHWQALTTTDQLYDAILVCDVIEHMPDPLAFLATLSARLKPRGKVILTTGNAQAWPWRLARAQFWYCYFPEHVSFIGPRWLSRMAPSAGLAVARLATFSHSPLPHWGLRAKSLLVTLLGRCAAAMGAGRPHTSARLLGGGISKDHIFCVLKKG